jgi:hypothetical protein
VVEEAHHDLGVDEVFGAAEGDETYLGPDPRRRGETVKNACVLCCCWGSHRTLF